MAPIVRKPFVCESGNDFVADIPTVAQKAGRNRLTPREEKALKLRFGIEDRQTRILEAVGKEFNVTRERIRQIEAKSLRKLRHPKLKDFLN